MAGISAELGAALALGLATGPVCLASCGPAVVPWMLGLPAGVGGHARQVALFLAARLGGYLLFGTAAWFAGEAVSHAWTPALFGAIQLALAVVLAVYALGWPRRRCGDGACAAPLIKIETAPGNRSALTLGFLTGINFCPPFLAAGAQAAESRSLVAALLFFAVFFVGTAVWFVPLAPLGWVRRTAELRWVARLAAGFVALWYGVTGAALLMGGLHG
jgi:sulfite exporter TauE/SafE